MNPSLIKNQSSIKFPFTSKPPTLIKSLDSSSCCCYLAHRAAWCPSHHHCTCPIHKKDRSQCSTHICSNYWLSQRQLLWIKTKSMCIVCVLRSCSSLHQQLQKEQQRLQWMLWWRKMEGDKEWVLWDNQSGPSIELIINGERSWESHGCAALGGAILLAVKGGNPDDAAKLVRGVELGR